LPGYSAELKPRPSRWVFARRFLEFLLDACGARIDKNKNGRGISAPAIFYGSLLE
jgi:hypothetical protein